MREFTSVHDAHCCKKHGCKYGDYGGTYPDGSEREMCPVACGDELGIACEECYWEKGAMEEQSQVYSINIRRQRLETVRSIYKGVKHDG